MLKNASFEGISSSGGWTRDTHDGYVYSEIFTPEGWVTWFEEGIYRRPECKVIPYQTPFIDPLRIYVGSWAWQAFTKFGRQHAGLYQVVQGLQPGAAYEFSARVHAWSAHPDIGPGDPLHDAHCSSGVGCGEFYMPLDEVQERYPLNGDPVNDAIGNFAFCVGVSFGDPDPLGNVEWSEPVCIYNVYRQVPAIRFIALSDRPAVVYLRAHSLWQFEVSDAYWDDVRLEVVTSPQPCRGAPRIQYPRTYNVIPERATEEQAVAVFMEGWRRSRETAGGSYDDAGLGDLDVRDANLYGIPKDEQTDYLAFYEAYYPGVSVAFKQMEGGPLPGPLDKWKPYLLWMKDPAWRNYPRAGAGCTWQTIGNDGCWDTICASAQRIFKIKADATPVTVNQDVGPGGFTADCQMLHSVMPGALSLKVLASTTSKSRADTHLAAGGLCLADVVYGSGKHFVLVTEKIGARYVALDPLRNLCGYLDEMYDLIPESWRLIERYEEPPPMPTDRNNIGIHFQRQIPGGIEYVRDAKPHYVKFVEGFEGAIQAVRANPDTIPVLRHYHGNAYDAVFNAATPEEGAALWWSYFSDGATRVARQIAAEFPGKKIGIEFCNEVYATYDERLPRWAALDAAFADLIGSLDEPLFPVNFCAAVGNPHETEFHLLVDLARRCKAAGGYMGMHTYWFANPDESGLVPHWKWLAGRWQEMDEVFEANGIHGTRWLHGESGAVGGRYFDSASAYIDARDASATRPMAAAEPKAQHPTGKPRALFIPRYEPDFVPVTKGFRAMAEAHTVGAVRGGYQLLPYDGWKSAKCYGGDFERYGADILEMDRRCGDDAAFVLFTSGGWGWDSFEIQEPQLQWLAAARAAARK